MLKALYQNLKECGPVATTTFGTLVDEFQGKIPGYVDIEHNTWLEKRFNQKLFNMSETMRTHAYARQLFQDLVNEEIESLKTDALKERLELYGLEKKTVTGDGNCFFRAIADQIDGNEGRHKEYRKQLCDKLKHQKDDHRRKIQQTMGLDADSIDNILLNMDICDDKEWIDNEFQIMLMSEIIKRPIRIISINGNGATDPVSERVFFSSTDGSIAKSDEIITIILKDQKHYDSTRRIM